eukprot:363382-Chlamydomonas_euryale.AAC.3
MSPKSKAQQDAEAKAKAVAEMEKSTAGGFGLRCGALLVQRGLLLTTWWGVEGHGWWVPVSSVGPCQWNSGGVVETRGTCGWFSSSFRGSACAFSLPGASLPNQQYLGPWGQHSGLRFHPEKPFIHRTTDESACKALHGLAWVCMALHEPAWPCMALLSLHGPAWTCMVLHGSAWTCMDLHGPAWTCMDLHGPAWTCMDLHGPARSCMNLHGPVWSCMDLHGPAWLCMALHGPVWTCMLPYEQPMHCGKNFRPPKC